MAAICSATSRTELGELLAASHEVGLAVDLEEHADAVVPVMYEETTPSVAMRPAFLAAAARPFLRRNSVALSMSPAVSTSAFLHRPSRRRCARGGP
jgi:hypothetical protein